MKKGFILLGLLVVAATLGAQTTTWVTVGSDGRLHYRTDSNGNRIMDFSVAGYGGGGVALPSLPVVRTVSPVSGDNTANIQAAINAVSQLAPNSNGFRGAVLLSPGTYNVNGTLNLNASGVVLRGSGSGSGGTTLNLTSGAPHRAFTVGGTGSWTTIGSSVSITDSYVPSGAMSFHVSSASGFSVGDTILIGRPVTAAWVHLMGMDTLTSSTGTPQTWIAVGTIINTDRVITAISGNQISVDAPIADSFDSAFLNPPGGTVTKYTFDTRISQVGVEHLKVIGAAVNVDINSPQYTGASYSAIIDSWMQDVAFQDTQNTITVSNTGKRLTFDNVRVTHTVTHTGDRMADFGLSGTQIFVNKSSSNGTGEWPLLTQGRVTGPIAVLNFSSTQQAGIGPHQRWAVGLLTDNATLPNAPNNVSGGATGISYSNRGNHGSGQGWAMGWGVAWNVTTPFFVVQEPPGAHNWCIGCVGSESSGTAQGQPVPNGIYESLGTKVTPNSLYLAQLCDRLGPTALTNIGYSSAGCTVPVPNFSLSASPTSRTVTAGGSTTYAVTVTSSNGFNSDVALSVSGLPAGASGSFTPASVSGGSGSSTLTVSTSASATPPGTYTLTITGTGGGLSRNTTVTFTVNAANVCTTATANGAWNNAAFPSHSGTFTATFDMTPSSGGMSAAVGVSHGAQTANTGFANIVALSTTGFFQVRDGGTYFTSTIHYAAGVRYHIRLAINVTSHTYSAFVTPAGGTEQTIETGAAFRVEQNTVTSLDHWGVKDSSPAGSTLQVCNFTAQ